MHVAEPDNALWPHGDACVADGASTVTKDGEPPLTSGLLGLGKIIRSCSTVGPE